jgi:hypothetical protein
LTVSHWVEVAIGGGLDVAPVSSIEEILEIVSISVLSSSVEEIVQKA